MAATLALAVAGCAADPSIPSLAPRPVEDQSLAEPAVSPPSAGTPDAAAAAEYAPIVEKAQAADRVFRETLAQAREAIAAGRGAAPGSDAWLAAQTALSRVETARTPIAAVLADLDAARHGAATQTDSGKALAATQAFETVRAIDAAEAQAMTAALPAG